MVWIVPGVLALLLIASGAAWLSGFLSVSEGKILLIWMVLWGAMVEAMLIIPFPQGGLYRLYVIIPFAEWLAKQIPGAGCTSAEDWIILLHTISVMVRVRKWPLPKVINIPLVLFLLYSFFESFNPYIPHPLVVYYGIRAGVLPFLMFYVGFYVFEHEREMRPMFWWIITIGFFCCLWAYKQEFIGLDTMEFIWAGGNKAAHGLSNDPSASTFYVNGMLRAFGPWPDPWSFAEFLVTLTMLAITMLFTARSTRGKLWAAFVILNYLFTIYLTQVKTEILGLSAAIVILTYARLPRRFRNAWACLVGAGFLAIILVMYGNSLPLNPPQWQVSQWLDSVNPLVDPSFLARASKWERFMRAIGVAPFGWGIGITTPFSNSAGYITAVTDSQWITYLTELGWPSIPMYLWLATGAFILAIRAARRVHTPFSNWFIPAMIAAYASLLIHFVFSPIGGAPGTTYFWFLFGAACGYPYYRRDELPDPERRPLIPPLRLRPVVAPGEASPSRPALPSGA
jgi:hypothetical protein